MNGNKVWSKLFECFLIGERVQVKKTANWVYKGWKGNIEKISWALGYPRFLVRSDKSREYTSVCKDGWHEGDPHLIGYFKFKDLELIE